ncbi:Sucraseferredoxin-like protein [Cynara cardunculus var. scolymus]|uniref:Sucraseferredoxin-like protein n=1 Tax=Cynara cardunculus var. scolymus TaxID=59895 RepID=A0A118K164_CYNCS|nr:Sucraseferredoxin-like protein [Cynara cardunculus var. scolymus]
MASNRDEPLTFLNVSTSSSVVVSEGDSSQIGSASGSFQNEGFLGGFDGGDEDFGFSRSEFRQSLLVGTVKYYERHVFLCYKKPQVWPPRIEAAEFDRLPRLLSAALTSRKEVLVKDGEWLPGSPEALRGSYIFVCAHGARDKRCGICGPALVSRFKDEIELRGHQSKVSVRPCSHIGGHKYAGNVIIFGSNNHGKVTGHWYGYVMPDDVPTLLEQHIEKGEIVDWLWRGQMGLSEDDQKKAQEQRVIANGGGNMDQSLKDSAPHTDEIYSHPDGSQVEDAGCCQANESSTCCRSPKLPENPANFNLDTKEKRKGSKNQISINVGNGGSAPHKVCTMPTWLETWESEDVYAALALIGAAVSVAVAYNCYRQLG